MPVIARLRRRLAADDGFTLVELVVTMAIGTVVLGALMMVFVATATTTARVTDRVDSSQRARLVLDRVVRLVDSQACLPGTAAPVLAGSTDSSLTLYSALGGSVDFTPSKYQVSYDPGGQTLTETRWAGTNAADGTTTIAASPTSTTRLAGDIQAEAGVPVFRYYAYSSTTPPTPTQLLATPLSAADATTVVRVAVALQAVPMRTDAADARSTVIEGEGFAPTADPTHPTEGARCAA